MEITRETGFKLYIMMYNELQNHQKLKEPIFLESGEKISEIINNLIIIKSPLFSKKMYMEYKHVCNEFVYYVENRHMTDLLAYNIMCVMFNDSDLSLKVNECINYEITPPEQVSRKELLFNETKQIVDMLNIMGLDFSSENIVQRIKMNTFASDDKLLEKTTIEALTLMYGRVEINSKYFDYCVLDGKEIVQYKGKMEYDRYTINDDVIEYFNPQLLEVTETITIMKNYRKYYNYVMKYDLDKFELEELDKIKDYEMYKKRHKEMVGISNSRLDNAKIDIVKMDLQYDKHSFDFWKQGVIEYLQEIKYYAIRHNCDFLNEISDLLYEVDKRKKPVTNYYGEDDYIKNEDKCHVIYDMIY